MNKWEKTIHLGTTISRRQQLQLCPLAATCGSLVLRVIWSHCSRSSVPESDSRCKRYLRNTYKYFTISGTMTLSCSTLKENSSFCGSWAYLNRSKSKQRGRLMCVCRLVRVYSSSKVPNSCSLDLSEDASASSSSITFLNALDKRLA